MELEKIVERICPNYTGKNKLLDFAIELRKRFKDDSLNFGLVYLSAHSIGPRLRQVEFNRRGLCSEPTLRKQYRKVLETISWDKIYDLGRARID